MFENLDPSVTPEKSENAPKKPNPPPEPEPKILTPRENVEDIFSDSAPAEGPAPVPGKEPITPSVPSSIAEGVVIGKYGFFQRYRVIIIIAIVIICLVVLVVWLLTRAPKELEVNQNNNQQIETTNISVPVVPVRPPLDMDDDGLTDEEEIKLGTELNNSDTDNDNLTDYEEVKVYKTDPTKADTDGDGFNDGDEVKGGFDPNRGGGAKLLDLDSEINKLNQD